jgi:hypothetical protein
MHVTAVLDAMKKLGHFSNYNKAQKAYEEATKAAELAEVGLALLEGTLEKSSKRKLKKLVKAKEAAKEALAKAQETEPEPKEAVEAFVATENLMKAGFQVDLEKAMQAQETAQGTMTAAATLMFTFYSNLLSLESKYAWNKIVVEQTEGNPYVNLQGVSLEGPRGMSCSLTSPRCRASSTAPMRMPVPSPRTSHSTRLNWGLMCCVCALSSGRTSTISTRKV